VAVNRDLIEWVFENLFKNSIDAIVKDDGFIEVRTEAAPKEKSVRIYHYDNGRGISREDQQRIFSPGFTTKKRAGVWTDACETDRGGVPLRPYLPELVAEEHGYGILH